MIRVTAQDGTRLMLNSDLIQYIEETPDTVIVFITGETWRVADSADEVRRRIIEFRREIGAGSPAHVASAVKRHTGEGTGWDGDA